MKYFHKSVRIYMNAYKDKASADALENLADEVMAEVENTLFPSKLEKKTMRELHIKQRSGAIACTVEKDKTKPKKTPGTPRKAAKKWSLSDVAILQANWNKFSQKYGVYNPFWFLNLKQCDIHIEDHNLHRFKLFISHGIRNWSLNEAYHKWAAVVCTPKTGQKLVERMW